MSLHQAYYTSCKTDWGGAGFQFNALSPALDRQLLGRLVDLCQYEPPPSQPAMPSEEELAAFPVNFFYQLLADGGAVLGREVYVGKGFDGRFGNFFAHLLVADSVVQDFTDARPIEFWNSPTWQRTPSAERDLPEPEPPIRTAQILDPDDLDQFFRAGAREAYLPAFFTAVESALVTGRRIVLVEPESEGVARWIALASLILPPALVLRFSFCTYHKNPERSGALLVGTTADSQFQFAPQQIRFQYFVLDFAKGRFSPALETTPFGTELHTAWQAGGTRAVTEFAKRLAALAADVEPVDLSDLGLLAAGDLSTVAEGDRAPKFLRWCMRFEPDQWGAPDGLARLFRETVRGGAARDEVAAAAAALHREVAGRYPADSAEAAHFEAAFEEWMASEVFEQATTTSLDRLVSMLAKHVDGPSDLPRDRWRAALEKASRGEPARAWALLQMGDALGWSAMADFPRDALAAGAAGLADLAPVQDLLLYGSDTPLREVLLTACAESLSHLPAHQAEPSALALLLRNQRVAETLAEAARGRCDFALACRVRLAAGKTGDRVELLRGCLAELSRSDCPASVPGALAPIDFAFTMIWGVAVPTMTEALGILDLAAVPGSGLSSQAESSAAVVACGRSLELELARTPEGRSDERAERQERLAVRLEEFGIRFPSANALAVRAELRHWPLVRSSDSGDQSLSNPNEMGAIEKALTLSASTELPAGLQEELRALAARGLVGIHSPQSQRQVLESAAGHSAAARQSFFVWYADAARTALESRPPPARLAALLFTVWHSLELATTAHGGTGLWVPLRMLLPNAERSRARRLQKVAVRLKKAALQRALLHWDSASRARAREKLSSTSLQVDWNLWEREYCPSGFRGWLLRRADRLKTRRLVNTGVIQMGTDQ
jgi:hypothetical protein